jgi:hypothetical protein
MADTTGIGIVIFPLLESYGGSGSAGDVTFPLLVSEGYGAGEGSLTLPLLEALGVGTSLSAIGDMTFPTLVALGSGTPGEIGEGHLIFPLLSTQGQGYSQTVGRGVLTFPPLIAHGVGLEGTVLLSTTGRGVLQFPLLVSDGVGLEGTIGIGSLSLPLLSVSGSELRDSRGSGLATLSLPLLEAYGYGIDVPITLLRRSIVMNLVNHAVTHYENFNFDSVVQFNGVLLGANENGVYLLGGDDDLGQYIEAELTSGLHDLSEKEVKAALEGWVSGRFTQGGLDLKVSVDENGDSYSYPFVKFGNGREGRAKIGKGLNKHRFFTFGVKNKGGLDFSIHSLRVLGEIIRRKTR